MTEPILLTTGTEAHTFSLDTNTYYILISTCIGQGVTFQEPSLSGDFTLISSGLGCSPAWTSYSSVGAALNYWIIKGSSLTVTGGLFRYYLFEV